MGVNMTIKMMYGVKVSIDVIDVLIKQGLISDDEYIREDYPLGYLDDCYAGEWAYIGKELKESTDFREDGWADFHWECEVSEKDKYEVEKYLTLLGIEDKPKIHCFTYYS